MKWQALKDNWLYYTVLIGLFLTLALISMGKADKTYVDNQDAIYLNEIKIIGDSLYSSGRETNDLLRRIVEGKR
jgi:hypothetical protein